MFNQKGQVYVILLMLFIVGFILYANFSKEGIGKLFEGYKVKPAVPSTPTRITPAPAKEAAPAPILTPAEPDTAPPKRLNVQPKDKSSLPPETRQVILGLETDEKAICRYSDVAGVSFDSMQGKFSQTGSTAHFVSITALSEGGKYAYYIKCADEQGNKNTDDLAVSFEVELPIDKTPPVRSNPSHQGNVLPVGTTSAVISISTDEPASCSYSGSMSGSFSYYDQTKKFHVQQITGLAGGKTYEFFVSCRDFAGNSNTGDVLISFSVAQ